MKPRLFAVLLGWAAFLMPAFSQTYVVTTIGGSGKLPYGGDGRNAATVDLFEPGQLAFDGSGNLYFTESYYNRVFRVAANGTLSTVAGSGQTGLSGGHGLAADAAGNLYVGVSGRLAKVTLDGNIRVIAGTGDYSYSGDGKPAVSATFDTPVAIALNSSGVIYFSDETHNVVRKIGADGIITTVAGTGSPGYSNDGQPGNTAQLNGPEGLAVDGNGNLYIADRFNHRVRKVRPDGTIATFAGTGEAGSSGDGVVPTQGRL
jgi:sugar lactone lactonase YvrE